MIAWQLEHACRIYLDPDLSAFDRMVGGSRRGLELLPVRSPDTQPDNGAAPLGRDHGRLRAADEPDRLRTDHRAPAVLLEDVAEAEESRHPRVGGSRPQVVGCGHLD